MSWFKSESSLIGRVWDLVAFMEQHDILIEAISTRKPGMIIYEDGHQIVAKPSKKVKNF